MAKQGQHKNDAMDQTKSRGHNNPKNSMTIIAGNVKKQETYQRQAAENKATNKQAQAKENDWKETMDFRDHSIPPDERTRARNPRSGRSGSDSNTSAGTRGSGGSPGTRATTGHR